MNRITKKEARILFNHGISIKIGGHDVHEEGAIWEATQFKQTTFDELCNYFEQHYCRGTGRFLKTEFYK